MSSKEVVLRLRHGRRWLVVGVGQLLAVFLLVVWRQQPPTPRSAAAPASQFSAARARTVEERLLAGLGPHPMGSPDNAELRQRLIAELRSLKLSPQLQEQEVCGLPGHCSHPVNVIAEIAGSEGAGGTADAVLVSAHYDSVSGSPGASDDGAGVAALLETARALKADIDRGQSLRHPVRLLFTDGEEGGMIGARAFMNHHPLARSVRAAVNVEAHGTSGQSLMFETGRGNLWLMRLYRAHIERPASGSLFYFVYRIMPNDTDFSIYRRHGITGFNFANIGHPERYHTPADNLQHAHLGTLQHHGENILATARALAQADFQTKSLDDAVWFDVLGWYLMLWPRGLTKVLGALMAILLCGTTVVLRRTGQLHFRMWLRGLSVSLSVPIGTFVATLGLELGIVFAPKRFTQWPSYGPGLALLFALLAVLLVGGVAVRASRRDNGDVMSYWLGLWTWQGALALALTQWAPEASYPWIVPALIAGLTGILTAVRPATSTVLAAILVPACAAEVILLPMPVSLYDSLGTLGLALVSLATAQAMLPLLPLAIISSEKRSLTPAVASNAA